MWGKIRPAVRPGHCCSWAGWAALRGPDLLSGSAMPMWKISTSSGGSSGGDGGSECRQQDHLGVLLAEQLVEDELAWGSNPGRALLVCSRRSSRAVAAHRGC